MMADYWAHHYYDNPKGENEVVDEDFDLEVELARIEAAGDAADTVTDWEDLEEK